tara:strand:+ start:2707 stop:4443 length:1737 start_codon:yes stop_codon:yes gene_type:complete
MERQANRLANQGRYGDSMMVHMNPTEVQVLDQMAPGGLTRNPQTGQPEAFAMLASLLASMAAKGALGTKLATLATLGNTISPLAAGAIASGATTAIQTGDLMEGVKAGVVGGLTGKVAGDLIGGLGLGEGAGAGASEASKVPSVDVASVNNVVPPSSPVVDINAGTQAFMPQAAPVVSSAPTDAFTGMPLPQAAPVVPAPDAGGMFAGAGDALGNMGMGDIVGPTIAGFVGDDAIAMYPGSGGDMEEEEEDPFYQAVRPSNRGIQMPGVGFDAGDGEFDYFANPFQAIPIAKTGGHLRQFEDGGKVDEPINLTGIRGFDQVTAPPSFDFSGTDIYGPAPVNMDDFNLSRTTASDTGDNAGQSLFQQIAARPTRRMPDLNAIGRGMYNLGGMGSLGGMGALSGLQGAIESYYPDNAGLSAFGPNPAFTAFGGRFAPDPVQVTPAAPASTPAFDTSAFNANQGTGMSNIGMGRMGGMEDFAMGGMGGMGGIGSMGGMSNVSTIPRGNRGPENVQANTGFNVGGMEDFSMGDMSGMGGMGSMDFNIPMEYAPSTQDSLYDPNQMNARIPGMGMAPRFGGMF